MIFVSDIAFTGLWQRPQELATRLGARVYLYPGKLRFGVRGRVGDMLLVALPIWHTNARSRVVNWLCFHLSPFLNPLMTAIQRYYVNKYCPKDAKWFVESVQLSHLAQGKFHFDIVDVYDFGRRVPKWFTERYYQTIERAHTISYTHPNLKPREDAVLVPNAANIEKMQKQLTVFGYYGAITDFMDWDYILETLDSDESYCVVLIGKVTTETPTHPRLLILPTVPHAMIPVVARMFDWAYIPWKRLALTEAVDPVKAHEYKALGLETISTIPLNIDGKNWADRVEQLKAVITFAP